jgi:hypothetical protein
LKRRVESHNIRSIVELKEIIAEEWLFYAVVMAFDSRLRFKQYGDTFTG